jgi:hypothetical protein
MLAMYLKLILLKSFESYVVFTKEKVYFTPQLWGGVK